MKEEEANQITALLVGRIRNDKPKLQHGIIVWEKFFCNTQQRQIISPSVERFLNYLGKLESGMMYNYSCLGIDEAVFSQTFEFFSTSQIFNQSSKASHNRNPEGQISTEYLALFSLEVYI